MNVEADLSKGHLAIEYFAYDDVTFTDTDDCETQPASALSTPYRSTVRRLVARSSCPTAFR